MPLEIQLRSAQPIDLDADVLVVGVPQSTAKAAGLSPSLKPLDEALGGALGKLAAKEEFTGKRDQSFRSRRWAHPGGEGRAARSRRAPLDSAPPEVRTFAAKAARAANGEKAKSLALSLPAGLEGHLRAVARGARARRVPLHEVPDGRPQAEGGARERHRRRRRESPSRTPRPWSRWGRRSARRSTYRRDLSNEPANVIYPETLRRAAAQARQGRRPEDRGLRLQGDPPPRHEAHRRRGPRQHARAALRPHLVRRPRARRRSSSSSARASRSTAAA